MYMIFFVLNSPERLDDLLEAWEQAGIHGATIIESTGLHRQRRHNLPETYQFQPPSIPVQVGHNSLFVIVETEQAVQNCLHATETVIGSLDQPNTGIFTYWPLSTVKGLYKHTDQ
jgi:hypothetical protein